MTAFQLKAKLTMRSNAKRIWPPFARICVLLTVIVVQQHVRGSWIWVEGERPATSTMHRHPYWYDQVKRDQLSGGDLISNFHNEPGEASYRFTASSAGEYELWVRANPIQAKLSYRLNEGSWTPIAVDKGLDSTNIAADNKPDLRFLAWARAGKVRLKKGLNGIKFRMDSPNSNHGYLDCFVFTDEPFTPRGAVKPDRLAAAARLVAAANKGWFAFDPKPDSFSDSSGINLRGLNEKTAGDGGFIAVNGAQFVHSKTGEPVRFWAVNGPSGKSRDDLQNEARMLAKHGVNLVRIHHRYFDAKGEVDPAEVRHAIDIVDTMKAEGIYSHFSIYFPIWFQPKSDTPWLEGYDGRKVPFAALFFNKDFQERYREWWKGLLLTPNPSTGARLVDDPAVAGLEILNEDSYLFWTFNAGAIPDPELRLLETQFGNWLTGKYGSINAALQAWGGLKIDRDRPAEGRMGFRPLWNMFNEKTARDQDTTKFLVESQRAFYRDTYRFLRGLGFKGLITASNWITASPEVFGPLEKYTYTVGDFIDRHGYFGCHSKGEAAEWSVRDGHTYADRSALRFEPEEPGKRKLFVHPAMDPSYDGKPSMISETTWNRPNRYRSEAPLFYAAYGALQDSDAIVHFALDTANWSVKPGFFMQPWTLMSPAMMGQFPAAALIYRKGLVATGDLVVDLNLKIGELLDLKGTPMPQDAALDELRLRDIPKGTTLRPGNVIDPLVHFVGRTNVNFTDRGGPIKLKNLKPFIDHKRQVVTSSTGQLWLDYGKGVLAIDAPAAQGISGALREIKVAQLKDLTISSNLELGHIVVVSLDGESLARSRRMLLQAMSEEKATDFGTVSAPGGHKKITSIGHDPWLVKELDGAVKFKRSDASRLKVIPLDFNGNPGKPSGNASEIRLAPSTVYYLITL
jgi:hypothetical protein